MNIHIYNSNANKRRADIMNCTMTMQWEGIAEYLYVANEQSLYYKSYI